MPDTRYLTNQKMMQKHRFLVVMKLILQELRVFFSCLNLKLNAIHAVLYSFRGKMQVIIEMTRTGQQTL